MEQLKEFVAIIASNAAGSAKFAFVVFSYEVNYVMDFTMDFEDFKTALANAARAGGSTATGLGLMQAEEMFSDESETRKLAVLITDGKPNRNFGCSNNNAKECAAEVVNRMRDDLGVETVLV